MMKIDAREQFAMNITHNINFVFVPQMTSISLVNLERKKNPFKYVDSVFSMRSMFLSVVCKSHVSRSAEKS